MNTETKSTKTSALELAALDVVAETGVTIDEARTGIRLALGTLILKSGAPVEVVNAYFESCGLPVAFRSK
jgi:hypothetical protein